MKRTIYYIVYEQATLKIFGTYTCFKKEISVLLDVMAINEHGRLISPFKYLNVTNPITGQVLADINRINGTCFF